MVEVYCGMLPENLKMLGYEPNIENCLDCYNQLAGFNYGLLSHEDEKIRKLSLMHVFLLINKFQRCQSLPSRNSRIQPGEAQQVLELNAKLYFKDGHIYLAVGSSIEVLDKFHEENQLLFQKQRLIVEKSVLSYKVATPERSFIIGMDRYNTLNYLQKQLIFATPDPKDTVIWTYLPKVLESKTRKYVLAFNFVHHNAKGTTRIPYAKSRSDESHEVQRKTFEPGRSLSPLRSNSFTISKKNPSILKHRNSLNSSMSSEEVVYNLSCIARANQLVRKNSETSMQSEEMREERQMKKVRFQLPVKIVDQKKNMTSYCPAVKTVYSKVVIKNNEISANPKNNPKLLNMTRRSKSFERNANLFVISEKSIESPRESSQNPIQKRASSTTKTRRDSSPTIFAEATRITNMVKTITSRRGSTLTVNSTQMSESSKASSGVKSKGLFIVKTRPSK